MNRKETVLVYGVTGVLLVILAVAIVFGNGHDARAGGDEAAAAEKSMQQAKLADWLTIEPARPPAADDRADDAGAGEAPRKTGNDGAKTDGETGAQEGPVALDHRSRVEQRQSILAGLGVSRRVRDYRVVTVRPGDTFEALVRRWCVTLEPHQEVARALNEDVDLDHLRPGQEIWLPWVDDDVVVEAVTERGGQPAHSQARPATAVAAAADTAAVREYVVRPGEALWKIAVRMTGSAGKAPAWIDRVRALNPGLQPDRVRAGQHIKIPAK